MRRLILAAALILGCASSLFAQTSPDPTEADHFTDAQGHVWTIDVASGYHTLRDGVWVGGGVASFYLYQCGDVYAWNGSPVWLHWVDGGWREPSATRPDRTCGSTPPPPVVPPPPTTTPPAPTTPVFVPPISGGLACEGPATLAATTSVVDATHAAPVGFRLYLNQQQAQDKPFAQVVNGEIRFDVVLMANTKPAYAVTAYNAAGETASSNTVQITVSAKPKPTGLKYPTSTTKATSFSWTPAGDWQSVSVLSLTKASIVYKNGCTVTVTK